jgi:predicted esterase
LDDLVPLARSLGAGLRVVAPEAARGVYHFREVVAHTWYGGLRSDQPEPASFGDSLAQIERFVHDVIERAPDDEPARPWLLGYEQGAVLALAAAAVIPDLLAGVMAVCGALPEIREWEPPYAEVSDLPVLLISDPADPTITAEQAQHSAVTLQEWGMVVTHQEIAAARRLGPLVSDTLRAWFASQRQPA